MISTSTHLNLVFLLRSIYCFQLATMKTHTTRVNIKCQPDFKKMIMDYAKNNQISLSDLMRDAVTDKINQKELINV